MYASSKEHLFVSLDTNKEALHLWESYLKKVALILEKVGQPFLAMEDDQLSLEQLSYKYSASKATILLTVIPGQYPPIPLPTISFVSSLIDEVVKYPKSIQTVSLLPLNTNIFNLKLLRYHAGLMDWQTMQQMAQLAEGVLITLQTTANASLEQLDTDMQIWNRLSQM